MWVTPKPMWWKKHGVNQNQIDILPQTLCTHVHIIPFSKIRILFLHARLSHLQQKQVVDWLCAFAHMFSYVLMCFICFQPTVATTTYVLNGFHMCPTIHVKNNNCFHMFPTNHVQHNMCTHVFICFYLFSTNHVKTNMYVHICFICFHMFPTNHVRHNTVS